MPGDVEDNRVREWHEIRKTNKFTGLKRQHIGRAVEIIKKQISLGEGSHQFSVTLQKLFEDCDSQGATTKVLGDLDDKTMIAGRFDCIADANDPDKINVYYWVNTLSTDLPRLGTRLDVGTVQDFSNSDLTKRMIENLTRDSEAALRQMLPPPVVNPPSKNGLLQSCAGLVGGVLAYLWGDNLPPAEITSYTKEKPGVQNWPGGAVSSDTNEIQMTGGLADPNTPDGFVSNNAGGKPRTLGHNDTDTQHNGFEMISVEDNLSQDVRSASRSKTLSAQREISRSKKM